MSQTPDIDSYKKINRLSDKELADLWELYLKNREKKELRDKLIVQYIYLARYVVGRIKVNMPPSFSFEDVVSFGIEGLIDAIEKYHPSKGAKFESYALMRIRGSIIDKIRSSDWLPRTMRRKIKEVKMTIERLKQEIGRSPTNKEIAEAMDMPEEKVIEILKYIEDNISERLKTDFIANYFHFDRSYLSRSFKKFTGLSLIDYINERKIIDRKSTRLNSSHT